ncbi:MAG: DNA/RNA non-specific endonuclease, partial [Rikenellaceae bacterium]
APTFNRDGWMRLEKLVRGWAAADSVIYVVTGPILSNPKGSLKRGGVTIPSSYYKVVFSPRKGEMIGFVMPNDKIGKALEGYAVTIDEVEAQTGIDLFAGGDFDKEEATIDLSAWSFTTTKTKTQTTDANTSATRVDPPQCKGVTTKGKQCRNTTTNANGYCHLHQSQAE